MNTNRTCFRLSDSGAFGASFFRRTSSASDDVSDHNDPVLTGPAER